MIRVLRRSSYEAPVKEEPNDGHRTMCRRDRPRAHRHTRGGPVLQTKVWSVQTNTTFESTSVGSSRSAWQIRSHGWARTVMKKKVVVQAALLTAALVCTSQTRWRRSCRARFTTALPSSSGTVAQHNVPMYFTGVGAMIARSDPGANHHYELRRAG
jgi:hypothetical protein